MQYGGIRRFRLHRHTDPTGISGTGCVAQGVVFSDGIVALRWLGDTPSTIIHHGIGYVEEIHCHAGQTVIQWEDPICFRCGACLAQFEIVAKHCTECGAGQGDSLWYDTRPEDRAGDRKET